MTTQTEALKRFLIGTSVENAEGSQIWYVDATTEKEALRIFNEGGADIYASEVEVTATGTPYIDGCTTLDDFGDFNDKPLAQPEQEPVAYFNPQVKGGFYWAKPTKITAPVTVNVEPMPLYTTPPQRKPLTDDQIFVIKHNWITTPFVNHLDFARAIEAAHGIKE